MTIKASRLSFLALVLAGISGSWIGCAEPAPSTPPPSPDSSVVAADTTHIISPDTLSLPPVPTDTLGDLEQSLIDAGLANIEEVDSTLLVELRYSTTNNFLGFDMYGPLNHCYLQPDVADKLALANSYLAEKGLGYRLLVYDGVRPRSIQQMMWDALDSLPVKERTNYVSNPNSGSQHNFGAAVDLTIADSTGQALDMGTPYDYFGELAYPKLQWELLEQGKLTRKQVDNRSLLRGVMYQAGFFGIGTEWWHFNSCRRAKAREIYQIVE